MGTVASRDLRNHTADVLRRVAEGERVAVTVHGEVVAEIAPPTDRRAAFLRKDELMALIEKRQADSGLRDDLEALAGDTTDDLGPIG
ncbi:type II toxin-antitoxin system Phd/YefM family antitoxin [Nocardioides speluncae]|uniref:type II toxin-antitoxin system Phd/YefM family antitoxin n=1 Tax=Nocardioides speluncae TaxID=2670337 RepID=UPI000D68AC34|nr:type II toxin-antitoxin system prevent-host-death family antitoxin [Nocardioides speluncae]